MLLLFPSPSLSLSLLLLSNKGYGRADDRHLVGGEGRRPTAPRAVPSQAARVVEKVTGRKRERRVCPCGTCTLFVLLLLLLLQSPSRASEKHVSRWYRRLYIHLLVSYAEKIGACETKSTNAVFYVSPHVYFIGW